MSSSINTILLIGATSGIGEAFAHRFHAMGKKVVATGRRQDRLDKLKQALPGLETYRMDNTNFVSLPSNVDHIMKQYPDINTVWVNSGMQDSSDFKDLSSTTDADIINEININSTAPTLLARHFIPHLLKSGSEANFMITSSGIGFTPISLFATYGASKAHTHHLLVALRQQLKGTNVNVWELVAPYVGPTELNEKLTKNPPPMMKNFKPMPLEEFVDAVVQELEEKKASEIKEIAPGSAKGRVDAWRASIGKVLEKMGLGG